MRAHKLFNQISNEDMIKRLEAANANDPMSVEAHIHAYTNSIWLRGDNTVESAKKPEYGSALVAKELYPDLQLRTVLDYVKEVYAEV